MPLVPLWVSCQLSIHQSNLKHQNASDSIASINQFNPIFTTYVVIIYEMISVLFHVHCTFRYEISPKWLFHGNDSYIIATEQKNLLSYNFFICFALFIFMYSRTNIAMYHCLYSIIFFFFPFFPHFHYFLLLNHITLLNLYIFIASRVPEGKQFMLSTNEIFFNIKK